MNIELPKYSNDETESVVRDTLAKMNTYFSENNSIAVGVSGGSDSDCIIHLICKYYPEYLGKVHFVFVNTGLEYKATKEHLDYVEKKYGIKIERIRGMSVVTACKKFGVPILSKDKSHTLVAYVKGFPVATEKIFGEYYTSRRFKWSENHKRLAQYIKDKGVMVSSKCCDESKKKPMHKYIKQNNIDLQCSGERRAEGGGTIGSARLMFHGSKGWAEKVHAVILVE